MMTSTASPFAPPTSESRRASGVRTELHGAERMLHQAEACKEAASRRLSEALLQLGWQRAITDLACLMVGPLGVPACGIGAS
eukprot:6045-Heterococcus_DN1.PRE.1